MASIVFDTLDAANRYKRAGFTEAQVEVLVEIAFETTALPDMSTLATKADLARLETKLTASQVQAMAIIIASTGLIVTIGSVISRLLH